MVKKVIITGASGLLGRAVIKAFDNDPSWEVTGLAFSRATGNLRKVDLTDKQAVKKIFEEIKVKTSLTLPLQNYARAFV